MQSSLYIQRTVTSTPYNLTQQTDAARSNAIGGLLVVILLPAVVIGAIMGYQMYRATVVQRQIQRLNRLWQLDSSQKPS